MRENAAFEGLWSLVRFEAEDGSALLRFRPAPSEKFRNMWPEQFVVEWRLTAPRAVSDRDEDPDWREFERALVPALERGAQACLAFVVTGSRYREWYFYCGDLTEMQGRLNREVAKGRDLPIELHVGHDPDWKVYSDFVGPFMEGA